MPITALDLSCFVRISRVSSSLSLTDSVFEGDGKAVLYTGDIRSEPWFVNSLVRNPCLIQYSSGIKTLDKIYLDTTFLENVPFQSKAEGIQELLCKVAVYPADTIFHFQAWTYGWVQRQYISQDADKI